MSKMVVNRLTGLEHGAEQWKGPVKTQHPGVHTKTYMVPVDGGTQCWAFYVQDASGTPFFLTEGDWILSDRSSWATAEEKRIYFAVPDVDFPKYYRDKTEGDVLEAEIGECTRRIRKRLGEITALGVVQTSFDQIRTDLNLIDSSLKKVQRLHNDK